MSLKGLSISLVLIGCIGTAAQTEANAGKEGPGSVIFCDDRNAVTTWPNGVSLVSLPSNQVKWKVMPEIIADAGPAAAGNTIAIITDTWYWIYGFSKDTGKLLWKHRQHSNVLGSDGKYFYALREDQDGSLAALSPDSGEVVWSVDVQLFRPTSVFQISGNLLLVDRFVIDLTKRAVVHRWAKRPIVSSIEVNKDGEILVGDSSGQIIAYDRNFKQLRTIHRMDGVVGQMATTGDNIVAAADGHRGGNLTGNTHGVIDLLTRDGDRKWEIPLSSDAEVDRQPFAFHDGDILIVEPGRAGIEMRLTSRKLATGNINWMTEDGPFFGPPIVCGDEVYVLEDDRIRAFSAKDGVERGTAAGPLPGPPAAIHQRGAPDGEVNDLRRNYYQQ